MKKLTDTMIWDNSEIQFYRIELGLKKLPRHADQLARALEQLGQRPEDMSLALQTVYRTLQKTRRGR